MGNREQTSNFEPSVTLQRSDNKAGDGAEEGPEAEEEEEEEEFSSAREEGGHQRRKEAL